MRLVHTLEEFRRDRYTLALASPNVLFWYPRRNLRIIAAVGCVTSDDMEMVTSAIADELAPGFTPLSSLVDVAAIERLDAEGFDRYVKFIGANLKTFARVNLRSAYVHGEGNQLATSAVAGYTRLLGSPFPTSNFSEVEPALAALGFADEAAAIVAQLAELKRSIREWHQLLGPLHAAIEEHLEAPTAAQIAREMNRSTRTLQRELSALGTTLSDEVRRIRVGVAKQLLVATSLPVEVVAQRAGFGSAKTFRSAFSREAGELPAAWRARQRRG